MILRKRGFVVTVRVTARSPEVLAVAAVDRASTVWHKCSRRLTVKLRGRPEAPDWSRGCTLSSHTRGDTTDSHGPLQRLLAVIDQ